MHNAIDTLRNLVEQAKWKCDEDPGCPTCAAEDEALKRVEALLQAAEGTVEQHYATSGLDIIGKAPPWDALSELHAAVRDVKGEA